MSGTSMAAPHVAGLAAYFAAKDGGKGQELCKKIQSAALKDKIKDTRSGSPNLLAFNAVE